MNPYAIDGPAVISFSGGRSSGFMLHNIIDAHGGTLPDDIKVIFANTGLEHHETYEFIHRIEEEWCKVVWLEYTTKDPSKIEVGKPSKNATYKIVDYQNANRTGEPFRKLIFQNTTGNGQPFLPNPVMRLCTAYLKIRTLIKYIKNDLGWTEWNNCIGLRVDEQRRVQKMKGSIKAENTIMPMAEAGHGNDNVKSFWKDHPLDLKLPLDSNIFGNCVGCFLKGYKKLEAIAREEPEQLDWWIQQEKEVGQTFVKDRPDYETIKQDAHLQQAFDFGDTIDCFCTD
jgi:3'-phosphoadenosine 5'-phosphosulfate sulfotransferase (PAPS reductase)/FAD synthetase